MRRSAYFVPWFAHPLRWLTLSWVATVATGLLTFLFSSKSWTVPEGVVEALGDTFINRLVGQPVLAARVGFLTGLIFTGAERLLYRKFRSFYIEFYTSCCAPKARRYGSWWSFPCISPLIGCSAAAGVAWLFKVSMLCAVAASVVPTGLLYRAQKKVIEEAKARLAELEIGEE